MANVQTISPAGGKSDVTEARTISVLPPSSPKDVPPEPEVNYGELRNKDGTLTLAGMKHALAQGSTITLIAAFDGDKSYSYNRIQDLPSQEEIQEFARRNHEHHEKLKQKLAK